MPLPFAALGAAASLAGGVMSANANQRANDQNLAYNREMYELQKRDALEFWNMQNEYNSPQMQMKRFQEAGLNPNLVYSQGNPGNAVPLSRPDVQGFQSRPVNFGEGIAPAAMSYISSIYDLEIKQAQADNLKAQNTVIRQDALLKSAQTQSTLTGTERSLFDLDFSKDLYAVNSEYRREQLRKLKADIDYTTHEDARKAASNSQSIAESIERMRNMKLQRTHTRAEITKINAAVDLMHKDSTLRQLEINLREDGINPNDPMWARMLGQALQGVYDKYFK